MRSVLRFAYLVVFAFWTVSASADAIDVNERLVQRDFLRVVMSAEIGGNTPIGRSVKKYVKPVNFAIINLARENRQPQVLSFIRQLQERIGGVEFNVVNNPKLANFRIYIVDGHQYADVIQSRVYKAQQQKVPVRGRCYVRINARIDGITESDAVILSDHSDKVFQRCLVEEVLQGLGPIADRANRKYSIFNTYSKHTTFTDYDRVIMNALYDPRIRPGMSKSEVKKILPEVIRDTVVVINSARFLVPPVQATE